MKLFNKFKKILVVEDDAPLLKALTQKCERLGFRVIGTDSGKDVLLLVQKENPDGILLDLMLPAHDGMTILETLRGQDMDYKKPVVILTNLQGRATLRSEAEKNNAIYLDKASTPIDEAVAALVAQL
jgi:DNA-binding response OmpR family regulator